MPDENNPYICTSFQTNYYNLNLKIITTMRKLFAILFVAAAFSFVACENKGGETAKTDTASTTVDTVAADPQPQAVDTTAKDTAAAQ